MVINFVKLVWFPIIHIIAKYKPTSFLKSNFVILTTIFMKNKNEYTSHLNQQIGMMKYTKLDFICMGLQVTLPIYYYNEIIKSVRVYSSVFS